MFEWCFYDTINHQIVPSVFGVLEVCITSIYSVIQMDRKVCLSSVKWEKRMWDWISTASIFLRQTNIFFFAFPPLFIYLFIYFICSEFCHTLKWNSHWFTCVPHPDPPSHLPLHPLPLGLPSEPGPSACLMHPTWAGDLFHPR